MIPKLLIHNKLYSFLKLSGATMETLVAGVIIAGLTISNVLLLIFHTMALEKAVHKLTVFIR